MKGLYRSAGKRFLDVGMSAAALVALVPLIAVIAVLVRWRLGAPVLFRQQRPGLNARPFVLIKFRSMGDEVGDDGTPRSDADRMTPLGRKMRSWSLDELPTLWNVLRGEMSLVGPRPLLMQYLPRYSVQQARRHEVRPGMTGWAQVNGRNALTWEEKFAFDVWYVDNLSLALDIRIIARTMAKVLSREGVEFAGRESMPYFLGSGAPHDVSESRETANPAQVHTAELDSGRGRG